MTPAVLDRELLDPAHQIETPESTVLALPFAGIGLRAIAYLVDLVLRLMTALSLLFVLSLFIVLSSHLRGTTIVLMGIVVFAAQWGYFTLFEGLAAGRTPGKWLAGVRVVGEEGTPVTLVQSAVRNLVRIVDWLPAFYGIGLMTTFVSRGNRRIGDLVAGTVVVKDGVQLVFPEPTPPPSTDLELRAARVRLSGAEGELLRRAAERRSGMTRLHQEELADRLVSRLRDRLVPEGLGEVRQPDERWSVLEAVARHGKPPGRESRDALLQRSAPRWRRLATLLGIHGSRLHRAAPPELRELGILYRRASADLAYAQTFLPRDPLLPPLQELVMQAHQVVYKPRVRPLSALATFYGERFPRVFRESLPTIQTALLVFLGFMALGLSIDLVDPRVAGLFLSQEMVEGLAQGRLWTDAEHSIFGTLPSLASWAIVNNNVAVAFAAFAGGILLGIGSLYVLAVNGLMLGIVLSATARHGMIGGLLSFIAAHGPLEIFIIVMSAGAGLLLARAEVAPGPYRRGVALTLASRDAFVLVGAAVPALVIAGVVESFVSPSTAPAALKAALGVGLLASFLTLALRRPSAGERQS